MTSLLTVEQIRESIERGDDDSASEFEDEIELRNLTEDEEEREVEEEERQLEEEDR